MPTLDLQVKADADSVIRSTSGAGSVGQYAIMMGANAAGTAAFSLGARFTGGPPQGSTITVAYLIITCNSTETHDVLSDLFGEDADNPASFDGTYADFNAPNRPRTTATVAYDGTKAWTEDVEEQLPSIVAILQEIVDRPNYNGTFVLFWEDGGSSAGEHLHGYLHSMNSAKAPKVHIEYYLPGTPSSAKSVFLLNDTGDVQRALGSYLISVEGLPGLRTLIPVRTLAGRNFLSSQENPVITLELHWSDDEDVGSDTVLGLLQTEGTALGFEYGPRGGTAGYPKYSGDCRVRGFHILSRVGSQVRGRCELQVEGEVERGTY